VGCWHTLRAALRRHRRQGISTSLLAQPGLGSPLSWSAPESWTRRNCRYTRRCPAVCLNITRRINVSLAEIQGQGQPDPGYPLRYSRDSCIEIRGPSRKNPLLYHYHELTGSGANHLLFGESGESRRLRTAYVRVAAFPAAAIVASLSVTGGRGDKVHANRSTHTRELRSLPAWLCGGDDRERNTRRREVRAVKHCRTNRARCWHAFKPQRRDEFLWSRPHVSEL